MLKSASLLLSALVIASGCGGDDASPAQTSSTGNSSTRSDRALGPGDVEQAFRRGGAPILRYFEPRDSEVLAIERGVDPGDPEGRPFYVLVVSRRSAVTAYEQVESFPVPEEERPRYRSQAAGNVVAYVPIGISGEGRAAIASALADIRAAAG